jgi:hypothetical protein
MGLRSIQPFAIIGDVCLAINKDGYVPAISSCASGSAQRPASAIPNKASRRFCRCPCEVALPRRPLGISAHAAAPLGRDFLASAGARSRLAAAMARDLELLPPARGARRDSRRAFRQWIFRGTVRDPRGGGATARGASQATDPTVRVAVRGGSFEPDRRPDAGSRLPSLAGNRLLYRDGLPVAILAADQVQYLEDMAPKEQWDAKTALLRRYAPVALDEDSESPAAQAWPF